MPAKDVLQIKVNDNVDIPAFRLTDMPGRTVNTADVLEQPLVSVLVAELSGGMYYIHAKTNEGWLSEKVVIGN